MDKQEDTVGGVKSYETYFTRVDMKKSFIKLFLQFKFRKINYLK